MLRTLVLFALAQLLHASALPPSPGRGRALFWDGAKQIDQALFLAGIVIGTFLLFLALLHACCNKFNGFAQVAPKTRAVKNEADKIFRIIDTNKSGTIELEELAAYLVRTGDAGPPSRAHALLMSLDTDSDGKISKDEWRRGWEAGLVGPQRSRSDAPIASEQPDVPAAPEQPSG